jgi:hypothetical protein
MSILPGMNLAGMGTRAVATGGEATFIATNVMNALPNPPILVTGASTGDIAIVQGMWNSGSTFPAGWTKLSTVNVGFGTYQDVAWKVLTSGDISAPGNVTVGATVGVVCHIIRGGTTVTQKAAAGSSNGGFTATGFTKAAGSLAVMAMASDHDSGTGGGATFGVDSWTTVHSASPRSSRWLGAGFISAGDYTDNASITGSWPALSYQSGYHIVEIT